MKNYKIVSMFLMIWVDIGYKKNQSVFIIVNAGMWRWAYCTDNLTLVIFGGGGFVVCQYEPKYFNLFSTPVIDATRYSLSTKILFEFICIILCKCNLYYVMSCFFLYFKETGRVKMLCSLDTYNQHIKCMF